MICQNCGKENRAGAKHCRFCGVRLEAAVTQPEAEETRGASPAVAAATSVPSGDQGRVEAMIPQPESPAQPAAPARQVESPAVEEQPAVASREEAEEESAGAGDLAIPEKAEATATEVMAAIPDAVEVPELEKSSEADGTPAETEPAPSNVPAGGPVTADTETPEAAAVQLSSEKEPEAEVHRHPDDPGAALETGVVLQGRYRILGSTVEHTPEGELQLRYEAEDLQACWNCQAVQTEAEPRFCELCGAELNQKPLVYLRAEKEVTSSELYDTPGEGFVEGGQLYIVERLAAPTEEGEPGGPVLLIAGYATDTGREREVNEDSLLALTLAGRCENRSAPTLGLYLVADGIGGHDAGEVASRAAIQNLTGQILQSVVLPELNASPLPPEKLAEALVSAAQAANAAILEMRKKSDHDSNMGCTLTAALVRDTEAVIANVGDSRSYLMRDGKLSQVTHDHSLVARWVEQGVIRPEEIYTHEQKSVIYRSLGDRPDVEIDTFNITLQPGDRLLLCSDGLWEMVRDPYIEDALLERFDPQDACNWLVEQANLAGGEDNIAVVILNVESPA